MEALLRGSIFILVCGISIVMVISVTLQYTTREEENRNDTVQQRTLAKKCQEEDKTSQPIPHNRLLRQVIYICSWSAMIATADITWPVLLKKVMTTSTDAHVQKYAYGRIVVGSASI